MANMMMPRALRTSVKGWLPDSLFGRLALLLIVVAIVSHALALSLLFKLHPAPPPPGHLSVAPSCSVLGPVHLPNNPPGPPLEGMLLDIGVRLGAVLLAAWIGARWLTAPMRRLALGTQELARDIHHAPLVEEGTRECREAVIVINQLQKHIQAQLEERDQFVAAVSHDLRTPLTRLALRVQSLQNELDRQRFGKDITEMDGMIRATLDYLRGAADPEAWMNLNLRSLVDSQVHDSQECGYPVTLAEDTLPVRHPIRIRGQISSIRRCIGNLDGVLR